MINMPKKLKDMFADERDKIRAWLKPIALPANSINDYILNLSRDEKRKVESLIRKAASLVLELD